MSVTALEREILENTTNIAVVGLSPRKESPSHVVGQYLVKQGYQVFPINPKYTSILGIRAYPNLSAMPGDIKIDVVNIFRHPADVPPIVEAAAKIKAPYVWMQEGIVNRDAEAIAHKNEIKIVMDRCIMKSHMSLMKEKRD